jgi:hypothetical protein
VLQDCPKANDGVVGFRDCAPSFTQYARYLGKDGKARHKDLETAILSSRNSTRAVDEAEVTGVELENTIGYGVLVAAIFASGALFL